MVEHKAKTGKLFPAACVAEAQRIEKLMGSNEKIHYMPASRGDSSFALMLATNHGMDTKKTRVCITDSETGELIYYTDFFKWFKRSSSIVNSNPIALKPSVPKTQEVTGLKIKTCFEFESRYDVEISIGENTAGNHNLSGGT